MGQENETSAQQPDPEYLKMPLKVVEKSKLNHNVIHLKLRSEIDLPKPRVCVFVRIYDDQNRFNPYTPILITKKELVFAIKVYPDSGIPQFLDGKRIGDVVDVALFFHKRKNTLNEFKNVLLIAGGTGITPMHQLLHKNISSDINMTDYTLLFLNKTDKDIFLEKELEALKKQSDDKLHVIYVLTQGTGHPDRHHVGERLTKDVLLRITNGKIFEFVYICGPSSLLDSFSGQKTPTKEQGELRGILKEIGYTEENVYKF